MTEQELKQRKAARSRERDINGINPLQLSVKLKVYLMMKIGKWGVVLEIALM